MNQKNNVIFITRYLIFQYFWICSLVSIMYLYCSNGPQKCSACIKEDIFEEPTSLLKQGCVSINISEHFTF